MRQLHYSAEKATQVADVCAALRNICIHFKVTDEAEILQIEDNSENAFDENDNESHTFMKLGQYEYEIELRNYINIYKSFRSLKNQTMTIK